MARTTIICRLDCGWSIIFKEACGHAQQVGAGCCQEDSIPYHIDLSKRLPEDSHDTAAGSTQRKWLKKGKQKLQWFPQSPTCFTGRPCSAWASKTRGMHTRGWESRAQPWSWPLQLCVFITTDKLFCVPQINRTVNRKTLETCF